MVDRTHAIPRATAEFFDQPTVMYRYRQRDLLLIAILVAGAFGCRRDRDHPTPAHGAVTSVPVRPLLTGNEGDVSATLDHPDTTLVVGEPVAWAAAWSVVGATAPRPMVDFSRDIAIIVAERRDSCVGYRTGVDSARAEGPDSVTLYLWVDHSAVCLDTTSRSVYAAALQRPAGAARLPVVVVRVDSRYLH